MVHDGNGKEVAKKANEKKGKHVRNKENVQGKEKRDE